VREDTRAPRIRDRSFGEIIPQAVQQTFSALRFRHLQRRLRDKRNQSRNSALTGGRLRVSGTVTDKKIWNRLRQLEKEEVWKIPRTASEPPVKKPAIIALKNKLALFQNRLS